ncbi:MAG TPA: hypothetical protein VLF20_06355 [Patescibacteria group bacterium]|nr:hypothetical protein [Patescibacteria group bacterium]
MKYIFLLFLFVFVFFATPDIVSAQAPGSVSLNTGNCFKNGVATLNCLPYAVLNGANAFLLFSGITALFIIVWAGIRLVISGGDAKQVQGARSMITYGIIGLIVVLSSYAIVFFIGYVTGTTNCITDINKITTGCR